jgi:hypothetical protein
MKSYQRLLMGRSRSGHPGSVAGMPLLYFSCQPSSQNMKLMADNGSVRTAEPFLSGENTVIRGNEADAFWRRQPSVSGMSYSRYVKISAALLV